ncbi:MAG TPA: hypothetical protein VK742_01190 [Candidatus Sulfotelmatobacter sp.]|jgi:hypothetical protein|nr:hypothetical protein [Candidatus Sulfotelmatobacter sp.]
MRRYSAVSNGSTAVLEPPPFNATPEVKAAAADVLQQLNQAAATNTPPPAGGLKKVSFGKIATKKEETKTAYPVLPDPDGRAAEIAARIRERTEQFEALKGALETDKAELKFIAAPHYFAVNHGRQEIPSSISVKTVAVSTRNGLLYLGDRELDVTEADALAAKYNLQSAEQLVRALQSGEIKSEEVLVTFANRYSQLKDESGLLPILGDTTSEFFRQAFELKINGDKLPADKTQELLNKLQNLFAEYAATDALEVKEGIKPVDTFHTQRHLKLSVEQNLALEQVAPIIATIKTKGRKT